MRMTELLCIRELPARETHESDETCSKQHGCSWYRHWRRRRSKGEQRSTGRYIKRQARLPECTLRRWVAILQEGSPEQIEWVADVGRHPAPKRAAQRIRSPKSRGEGPRVRRAEHLVASSDVADQAVPRNDVVHIGLLLDC